MILLTFLFLQGYPEVNGRPGIPGSPGKQVCWHMMVMRCSVHLSVYLSVLLYTFVGLPLVIRSTLWAVSLFSLLF